MTQIQPVIRDKGIPYFAEQVDPVNQSYLWNPRMTEVAFKLKEVAVITTYHEFISYGKFEPTVVEVLAAIPVQWLHGLVAFEIIEQPESVDDLRRAPAALADDHHMARTRLYCYA